MGTVENELSAMHRHAERFTEYVTYVSGRSDKTKLNELAALRRFSPQVLEKQQIFYVPKSAASLMAPAFREELRGFGVLTTRNTPVFYDRWVFPIRNSRGQVVNLVGYSNKASTRYIYGKANYFDRRNTLFGLENLHLVSELGYAIVTEGITDTLRLRDMGFLSTFAMCGTHSSDFIFGQINRRAERGVVCVPDRDEPGQKALKGWKFENRYVIWPDPKYKDVDEMCRENPQGIPLLHKTLTRVTESLGAGVLSGDAVTVRVPQLS
ncbi:hypothetical protein FACS1894208_02310 [Clostridia bacterium]|nr:hypothetical protein FACS1894208_02310 [Clostridia bacterium]